jgi:NAD(P)-dependent dehydrogenase (short-subunit alcohol dehydrogenase family)
VNGIQAFMPIMEEQGEGHISATSSMSGLVAFPPVVVYNVAKFGVIAIMETFVRELRLAKSPIEASVFCPGEVATHAIDNAMTNAARAGLEATQDEIEAATGAQAGLLDSGMDADEAGRVALDGIRQGRFWIFSHPQWVDQPVRARFEAMASDGSLPDF